MTSAAFTQEDLLPPAEPLPEERLAPGTRLAIYRAMALVRALDTKMVILQRQGRISFYGPITGQEAGTIGPAFAIRPGDWAFPALREAGLAMARGLALDAMIAQCFGNALDVCKGRQMPCHYVHMQGGYYAMSSAIGTQLPHAVGCAHASKIRGERQATLAFLGDGATSEGDFHAAMNFAGVFQVPCVFVCQNNHWAITVPFRDQTATPTIAEKAQAYGFPGVRCDGNDVFAVYETVRRAAETARAGGGPTLVECVTYRVLGHTTSDDPSRYRDEDEVRPWRERDPLAVCERRLLADGVIDAGEPERTRARAGALVEEALARVEAAPPPARRTLIEDVFARPTARLEEQLAGLERELAAIGQDPLSAGGH